MTATPGSADVLRMEAIEKRFAGVTALAGVDLALAGGEVHALVGENGAGKSTLIKVMTGASRPDGGRILLGGRPVAFATPQKAQAAGVIAVHQEVHLLRLRSVAENILAGREPTRLGFVHWRRLRTEAQRIVDDLGLDLDVRTPLAELRMAQRQMVAIARGISLDARVLVLDEPTSSLADPEVQLLMRVIATLRDRGTAIVYVSHRFDELYAICDRVTVLRDGRHVATRPLAGLPRLDLVCLMLGKSREELAEGATGFADVAPPPADAPLLRVAGLRRGGRLRDVSLDVRPGEVVGLGGLLGSGRSETARAVFGAEPAEAGTIELAGRRIAPRTPQEGIAAGIGFVSEDRKGEGIIPELSVRENLTLAALPRLQRLGIVDRAEQRRLVDDYIARLGIRLASPDQAIRELSGGNQQKVLLARWLCTAPSLLLVDEPTRGIDIGARGEIQRLLGELARSGLGVLLVSSDLEELVEGTSRVVVLRDGRAVAEFPHEQVSQDAIIGAMAGDDATAASHAGSAA